ncbi:MAG: hypothetical protein WA842_06515 [Croceibacterium sp.]
MPERKPERIAAPAPPRSFARGLVFAIPLALALWAALLFFL